MPHPLTPVPYSHYSQQQPPTSLVAASLCHQLLLLFSLALSTALGFSSSLAVEFAATTTFCFVNKSWGFPKLLVLPCILESYSAPQTVTENNKCIGVNILVLAAFDLHRRG